MKRRVDLRMEQKFLELLKSYDDTVSNIIHLALYDYFLKTKDLSEEDLIILKYLIDSRSAM